MFFVAHDILFLHVSQQIQRKMKKEKRKMKVTTSGDTFLSSFVLFLFSFLEKCIRIFHTDGDFIFCHAISPHPHEF